MFQTDENRRNEAEIVSAAILPLLSGEGNQRLLLDWIESHDEYTLVDPDEPVETVEFDCCLLDGEALETHADTLRERKRDVEPVLLPCLLLLPEADLSVLEIDRGEIADGVIFETVDEVVSMPIKKAELEWRTKALLRLRRQSLQLDRNQRELRKFKQATEAAGHAVYITDTDGRIEYVNTAFEEITGYDKSEALGETPELLHADENSATYFERLWETISNGDIWEESTVNERKDGELYHAYQTIAPVKDETGTPVNYVAIQSDITPRVEAEQELELFRDIVERIDDPIMLQGRDGQFRVVNDAVTEYAGMSREDLLGETESAFMDEKSADRIEARKKQVLDQERAVQYTITPTFPDEDEETFSTVRYPYYGRDGTLDGTIAICRTVTELKSREDQLEVIDRVLRHNLRNDMTTIGMYAEKLEAAIEMYAEELEPTTIEDLVADAKQVQTTTRKVNETVEKERKITKFLTERMDEVSIDLVRSVETISQQLGKNYPNSEISYELPDTCSVQATVALDQAVEELLENAIVHSDQETPSIDVQIRECTDGSTLVVADDGPGIHEMDRKVLTEGAGTDQLYHGSGLGLWLVHLIVTHSDGTIMVSENEPRGSIVSIQFQ